MPSRLTVIHFEKPREHGITGSRKNTTYSPILSVLITARFLHNYSINVFIYYMVVASL